MPSPFLLTILDHVHRYLPEPHASLLEAITFGIPLRSQKTLYFSVVQSGVAHVVVLSGANLTLLTQLSERLVEKLEFKQALITHCCILLGFVFLVGLEPPLWRAFCMFGLQSICMYTGRPSYPLWNLFLTIFFTSILFPAWMNSVSFYLSCTATFGIILSSYFITKYELKLHAFIRPFFDSWIILFCTFPITLLVFKTISLIGPFTTTLVSPLILPLMILGILLSVSSLLFPPLGYLLAFPALGATSLFLWIIRLCAQIPFGQIKLN